MARDPENRGEDTPLADADATYEEANRRHDRLSPAAMGGAGGSGAGTEWPSPESPPEEPAPGTDPRRARDRSRTTGGTIYDDDPVAAGSASSRPEDADADRD